MGGHGGLNILPQKKWNVYRKDVQFKVHFNENKIIKETKEKEKEKNALNFEKNINELKRNLYDRKRNGENEKHGNEKTVPYEGGHINLFAEEEKEINRKKKLHEEYLIKSGHYIYNSNLNETSCIYNKIDKVKIVSDFDKIKQCQDQWFLSKKNYNCIFHIEQNDTYNDTNKMQKEFLFKENIRDRKENEFKRKKLIDRNIEETSDEENHLYNQKIQKNINGFKKEEKQRKQNSRDRHMERVSQRKIRKQEKRKKIMNKERSKERKKEREKRKRSRHKDVERNTNKGKDRDKDKARNRDKDRNRDRDKSRNRDRDKSRNRDRDKDRDKDRNRDRDKDRDKDRNRDKDRDRDKNRDRDRDNEMEKGERKKKQCKSVIGNEWYF